MWTAPARRSRLVASILVLVAVAARARTFGNPVVGFDEQFYLLVGARMWDGTLPFVDLFDRKPVGLFLIYAAASGLGDGFAEYKLLALASVVATAWLIHVVARRSSGDVASTTAAALYVLWLDLLEGEGGQSPVFYDLPMIAAVAILVRLRGRDPRWRGAAAMVLVGVALQIKYSVVVEGVWFGCWLIAAAWRRGQRGAALAVSTALWIGCALAPTALALACYAAIGQAHAFVFANFLSAMARGSGDAEARLAGAAAIAGILAPLWLTLLLGWRGRSRRGGEAQDATFLLGWLAAAVGALVLYGRYASPHYAIPLLLPLACLLAPVLDGGPRRRAAGIALALAALAGGQAVLAVSEGRKGGAEAAAAVARAADPHGRGCIWVHDGYPALYMLAGSCLPTRWAFPGHLNTSEEASAAALGIDPALEVRRILATRPVAIVDDFPAFGGGNPETRRLLARTLAEGYALAACVHTGPTRVRLVYRRREEHPVRPAGCPTDAALRRGG